MGDGGKRRASYADLLAVPEHLVGEILGGELIVNPRPSTLHSRASSALGGELYAPFDRGKGGPGGWLLLDEPQLALSHLSPERKGDMVVPDLAGWRRDRMAGLPQGSGIDVVPDWVCEVLSPMTVATDRTDKLPLYARAGVGHVWLLDPHAHTLEVYERQGLRWMLAGAWRGEAHVKAAPFEALELELGALWA